MEDTLRVKYLQLWHRKKVRLNPYYNGRYATRTKYLHIMATRESVLILIIMEDTLRVQSLAVVVCMFAVLILIIMEDTLRVRRSMLEQLAPQRS